jgi:inositol oxygenase
MVNRKAFSLREREAGWCCRAETPNSGSCRDYDAESERKKTVEEFYRVNHIRQTHEFVSRMRAEYGRLDKTEMGIWDCIELLNEFIDDSDPDLDMPQIEHLLQTAEAIRKDYPDQDWLHLTGLIHGACVAFFFVVVID